MSREEVYFNDKASNFYNNNRKYMSYQLTICCNQIQQRELSSISIKKPFVLQCLIALTIFHCHSSERCCRVLMASNGLTMTISKVVIIKMSRLHLY